jgi:predicted PurR-regulated permease PerM
MTSATDTDIQQIKDLIAAGNAATQKQIGDLREEMRVGFTKIDGELKEVTNRLIAVESSNKTIDGRLWSLIGTLLGLTVTALLGIFIRYLFAHDSII